MNRHLKSKHSSVKHHCKDCSYSTSLKQSLRIHREAVHLKIKYDCNICKFQATTRTQVNNDVKRDHLNIRFKCNTCDYETKWKQRLSIHSQTIHENMKENCKICNTEVFKTNMKSHLKLHLPNARLSNCDLWEKQFKSEADLKSHRKRLDLPHINKKYECSMCNKEYIVKTELKRHIESQHMESNLKCNICLYQTSNKKLLKRHQLIHGPTKIWIMSLNTLKWIILITLIPLSSW